ncbi:MAG: acyltransferase [Eubacteriales bacterium]|nr:acyltransferase [Eubacteriales bacterium]
MDKQRLIDKKKLYTFILGVLVVWVHSVNNDLKIQELVSAQMGQFAVPGFFIVSGFMFFRNFNNIKIYLKKIKSRIHTLLIPFFMWNTIYYIIFCIIKAGVTFSLNDFIQTLVFYKYNPVFWFMYQLIVLSILSIFIYFIYKNKILGYIYLLLLLFFISQNINIYVVNVDALFYFSLGAFLSKYKKEQVYQNKNPYLLITSFIIFFISLVLLLYVSKIPYLLFYEYNITLLTTVLIRSAMPILLWTTIDYLELSYQNDCYNYLFFMYCIHYLIVRFVLLIFSIIRIYFLRDNEDVIEILSNTIFLMMPLICMFISYYFAKFLKKIVPNYYNLLTGGR